MQKIKGIKVMSPIYFKHPHSNSSTMLTIEP